MAYQNVLIAFDGSQGSMKALHQGIEYAKNNDSHLSVIYVTQLDKRDVVEGMPGNGSVPVMPGVPVHKLNNPDPTDGTAIEQEEEQLQAKGEEVLHHARAELNKAGLNATTEVLEGEVAERIERYAVGNETDLIMIGSRGLGGLKKLVLGSVSQKVVQRASCPVLVVK